MRDVKTKWNEMAATACLAVLLVSGCDRGGRAGAGLSRDVIVSTASLSPGSASASPAAAPSETLAEVLLTSGSSAESDGELAAGTQGPSFGERAGTQDPSFGERAPACVQGWSAPPRGSALRKAALDMMRTTPNELFLVDEIRYFVGPEDADVVDRRREVERWYIKARTDSQPERRQRWLVRRAAAGSGIDAVAPYDSQGYGPGVWMRGDAVDPSFADPFQRPCNIAPNQGRCMGLPREVLGCLSGT